MAWDTAANIISDAASELGLVSAAIASPYTSTDPNIFQLTVLLKGLGQDLARRHNWKHLETEHTFATVSGTYVYDWPSDFLRFIDQTAWNRTDQLPMGGPASAKDWQTLKASSVSDVVYSIFRTVNDELWLYPTPTSAETIAFEYVSSFWVEPVAVKASLLLGALGVGNFTTEVEATTAGSAGNSITVTAVADSGLGEGVSIVVAGTVVTIHFEAGVSTVADAEAAITALTGTSDIVGVKTAGTPENVLVGGDAFLATALAGGLHTAGTPDAEAPSAATDVLHFERRTLIAGLKLYWLREKGFDTTAAQDRFDEALGLAQGADGAAPAISLNRRTDTHLIDTWNLPQTNYGQ